MAVVTTKATAITNRDATPAVLTNGNIVRGDMKEFVGIVEGANGDSIASKFIYGQIPSNARVTEVLLSCDAISTSGAMDVGIYQTTQNGGAVVDADFFASAVVLTSALLNSDITQEADPADAAAGFGKADSEKMLWQALGLSSDPNLMYDVVGTLTTALGGAGTTVLKVRWVE